MLDCGFRVDFLVQQSVVVEVKAIDHFDRVHTAQVLTYLRLTQRHLGLLINFNVKVLSDGEVVASIVLVADQRLLASQQLM